MPGTQATRENAIESPCIESWSSKACVIVRAKISFDWLTRGNQMSAADLVFTHGQAA